MGGGLLMNIIRIFFFLPTCFSTLFQNETLELQIWESVPPVFFFLCLIRCCWQIKPRQVCFLPLSTTVWKRRGRGCTAGHHFVSPTSNALLINFLLSSDSEILLTSTDWPFESAPKRADNVCATCTRSDWASIFACHPWWLGTWSTSK